MHDLFSDILRVSVQGGVVILAVMLLRLALKKAPKRWICLLWLLAGLRLLVPVQIESPVSLQPDYEPMTWEQTGDELSVPENDYDQGRGEILDDQGNVLVSKPLGTPSATEGAQGWGEILDAQGNVLVRKPLSSGVPAETAPGWVFWIPYIWLAGVAVMGLYTMVSYWNLKRKVADAVILEEGVWVTNRIDTPFLLGFVHPKIYLPVGLTAWAQPFVLAHERVHLRRKDHWWKLLGFTALAVHWFNPLVWVGYVLLCRDLEMACDEAVVQSMDLQQRKAYSAALVSCSAIHRSIAACPIAFGEVSVKERVTHVLSFKKRGFWLTVLAVAAAVFVAVFFLTSPGMTEEEVLQSLYQEIQELQDSHEKHIVLTMDMDSEFEYITSQRQEVWYCGEDMYLHIDYETPMGSFVEGYMQLDGVQYAMDHSEEIDGFENRPWAEIPEENYVNFGPLLTRDFTQLEVLDIRKEEGEDGGNYTIVLKNDKTPEIHGKVYEATYTFRLDGEGKLIGIRKYTHEDVYMSGFGLEGIFETKTQSVFEILDFDTAEFTEKTGTAWMEIMQDEGVDLSVSNETVFKEEQEALEQKLAELEAEKIPPNLLLPCQSAVLEFQSRENICLRVENQFSGDILNDGSTVQYFQSGEDWLLQTSIGYKDCVESFFTVEKDGVHMERHISGLTAPVNGPGSDTGWVAELEDSGYQKPWLSTVKWEELLITGVEQKTVDGKTWIILTVFGSPYEMEETVTEYQVAFVFENTELNAPLSQVILEYDKSWPMLGKKTAVGHVISTIYLNTMAPEEASVQIEAMYP